MAGVKFAGEEAVERIAHYVNKKLNIASTMPSTPNDENIILYVGESNESYIQGCIYEYDEINEKWKIINSVQTVELTTAEYESLPVSVQNNGTIYFLTDGEGGKSGGSANYYGTCTGQASNQVKTVTISSDQGFELKTGVLIFVKFDANNTYDASTSSPIQLNVNNTGAKQIYAANTATPTGTNTTYFGRTNYINQYIYNGTYWVWNGSSADNNTTYTPQALGFGYGTCSTAAATAAKVVTLSDYTLVKNGMVSVKFTNDVPANATMNIDSKGAKNIWYQGASITAGVIKAGDLATFIYDGTRYQLIGIDRGTSGGGYTPIVLSGTLEAGETEITFTDSNILEDSMIDIFIDSDEDLYPTSKTSTVGEIVLEFEAQSSDLNIALLIFNLMS